MSEMSRPSLSASSSMSHSPASKADSVVHRVYLKTVAILVESRLTHYTQGVKGGERKKDKWFALIMPEIDLHRQDLKLYQTVSAYPLQAAGPSSNTCTVPPLLIAFILDTTDVPSGQAVLWNRAGEKIALDTAGGKGKGKEREEAAGILLERWTFRATIPPSASPSSSQQAAPQAYRLGVIHFRAMYSLVRLLPAYKLYRRLRRTNTGLKIGIKLWSPEGYANDDVAMKEAWDVMERDLIGLDTGLEAMAALPTSVEEDRRSHIFPPLEMFGLEYSLSVRYRAEVDFQVEDLESVLSEKFVDMEEDWFTPTVARHRMEDEAHSGQASVSTGSSVPSGIPMDMSGLQKPDRRTSGPAPIPAVPSNASPIPQRQAPASLGSFRGSIGRPSSTRVPSGLGTSKEGITPGSLGKWGALGEGLPFAQAASPRSPSYAPSAEPPSPSATSPPSGAMVTARRLSGHSVRPTLSPSTSVSRHPGSSLTGQYQRPGLSTSKPSSIGRTSSFLSQSGRSFTHAQLASMSNRYAQPVPIASSMSPPIPGTTSNMSIPSPDPGTSASPSSLSFTKQPILRSFTNRPPFASNVSSPFAPSSLDKDANLIQGSPGAPPQIIKRYSSYSARRDRLAGSPAAPGSQGSSGDGSSLPGSAGQGYRRRLSMRTSYEAGLRRSMENSGSGSGSGSGIGLAKIVAEDSEDIEAFLKTLDSLPQPPSIAAQSVHASRLNLPSTSSSLSTSSSPSTQAQTTGEQPGTESTPRRAPTTRAQIDAELRRMIGSFQQHTPLTSNRPITPIPRSSSTSGGGTPSIGLLSASRPMPAPRRQSQLGRADQPSYQRSVSTLAPNPTPAGMAAAQVEPGPSAPLPVAGDKAQTVIRKPSARSLPGPGTSSLQEDQPAQLHSAGIAIPINPLETLSPQTTGGTIDTPNARSRRSRGPVLLRGGFGDTKSDRSSYAKSSVSSSPSHSPVRDFGRLLVGQRDRERTSAAGGTAYGERQAEEELDSWTRTAGSIGMSGATGAGAGFVRHKSSGPAMVQAQTGRTRLGLGTAPSSYIAGTEAEREGRRRATRVKSDGEEGYD